MGLFLEVGRVATFFNQNGLILNINFMRFNVFKLISIASFCTVSLWVTAQKNDSTKTIRNVQIEREYTPEITPVERPNIEMQVIEPNVQKESPAFSNYIKFYDIESTPLIPLQPQELGTLNRETPKSGFFRFGFAPLFRWVGDFWYPVWNTDEGYFDIFAHHDGILSVGTVPPKKLFRTSLGLNFNKNFDDLQLYLTALYANESFNYYGNDTYIQTNVAHKNWNEIFTLNQSFNKAKILLGLRARERDANDWLWDGSINYNLHSTASKVTEHNVNALFDFDRQLDDNFIVGKAAARVYFYGNRDTLTMKQLPNIVGIDSAKWKTNVLLSLNLAYLMDLDNLKIKIGAKTFFSFGKTPSLAIAPDAKLDYFLDDFLNLFAGITGDYTINSLAETTQRNRYFNLSATRSNTYTPFDVFGGFKVKVLKGLMLNASINYKYVLNAMFFKNNAFIYQATDTCYNRFFETVHYHGGLFEANVGLSYNIKERTNIFISMEYDKWTFEKNNSVNSIKTAWHTPEWRINAGTDFKVGKNFFGGVHFYFASKAKAEQFAFDAVKNTKQTIIELPATYDLNLNAGYNVSKNLSVFAQLNNILAVAPSMNAQPWYGYKTMGFNGLIGFTVQF